MIPFFHITRAHACTPLCSQKQGAFMLQGAASPARLLQPSQQGCQQAQRVRASQAGRCPPEEECKLSNSTSDPVEPAPKNVSAHQRLQRPRVAAGHDMDQGVARGGGRVKDERRHALPHRRVPEGAGQHPVVTGCRRLRRKACRVAGLKAGRCQPLPALCRRDPITQCRAGFLLSVACMQRIRYAAHAERGALTWGFPGGR